MGKSADGNSQPIIPKAEDDDDEDDVGMMALSHLDLPHKIMFLDKAFFRDTGKLLYQAQVLDKVKHSRIKIVLATSVNATPGKR